MPKRNALTPAQRKALEWFREREKACLFGRGDPSMMMVKKLHAMGYLMTSGSEHRPIGMTYYALSCLGRVALESK